MAFFFSRFVRTFSALLGILLLKYFGSDDILGSFSYWYVLLFFAAIFIKFNHQVFILHYVDVIRENFAYLFFNQLFFWILFNIVFLFFLPLHIYIINLILLTVLLFDPWESYYTIVKGYALTNKVITAVSFFSIGLKVIAIIVIQKANLVFVFLLLSVLDFSTGLMIFIYYERDFSYYKKFEIKKILETFKFLFPFLLNTMLIFLAAKIDHLLIKNKFDYVELGIYSFSYRLYEGLFIFQVILNSIVISKYKENFISGKFQLGFIKFLKKWFFISALFVLITCSLLFFIVNYINLEFINGLNKEIKIFIILLPGLFFSFFGVLMAIMASCKGYSKEVLFINIIVFLLSFILNYFLLDIYGLYIAAIITLINQFLSSFLLWFCFSRTRLFISSLVKSFYAL